MKQTPHQVHGKVGSARGDYGKEYFAKYLQKNKLGIPMGSKPFLYAFWLRYVGRFFPAHASILEVGCGVGFFATRLHRAFPTVGLDISFNALEFAHRYWGMTSLVCGTAESLPFGPDEFDIIFALDVLEHFTRSAAFFP